MRLNISVLLLFSLSILLFISCEDEKIVLSDKEAGYAYYPVEVGKYWIYKIDSTLVPGFKVPKINTTSFIKEQIANSYINSQGDTAYVIQRSRSQTIDGFYEFTDRWALEKTTNGLTRIEENLQFLKIIFPVIVGNVWEGNKFDQKTVELIAQQQVESYKEWEYKVLNKRAAISANGVNYQDVLEIQQADYETEVELRQSKEYYVEEIGLVYREMTILNNQCFEPCEGDTWLEKAIAGFVLKQTLVEHN